MRSIIIAALAALLCAGPAMAEDAHGYRRVMGKALATCMKFDDGVPGTKWDAPCDKIYLFTRAYHIESVFLAPVGPEPPEDKQLKFVHTMAEEIDTGYADVRISEGR